MNSPDARCCHHNIHRAVVLSTGLLFTHRGALVNTSPLLSIASLCLLAACTPADEGGEDPGDDDISLVLELEENPNSSISFLTTATSSEAASVQVAFWSEETAQRQTGWSSDGLEHHFSLIGMRAETEYSVQATLSTADGQFAESEVYTVSTGALPDEIVSYSVDILDDGAVQPGLTFFGPAVDLIHSVALDSEGEVVWYFADPETEADYLDRDVKLLDHGELLLSARGGFQIIDPAGNILLHIQRSQGEDRIHHDALRLPNGNFLALTQKRKTLQVHALGGETELIGDGLVELDRDGNEVWSWSSFDHLDTERFPGSLSTSSPPKGEGIDWTHANGLHYIEAEDTVLMSLRHQSWIINIDHQTGEILWRIGEGGDFELANGDWFYSQHAPELTADGSLLVYDNGNERPDTSSPYSRAVMYTLDETAMTATQTWEYITEEFTSFLGDANQLDNGNILLCAGGTNDETLSQVLEVSGGLDSQPIWDLRLADLEPVIYRAKRLPESWPYGE
jgi:hypothetical protein